MPLKLIAPGQRKNNRHYLIRGKHEASGRSIERTTGTRNAAVAENRLKTLIDELDRIAIHGARVTFEQAALNYVKDGGEARYIMPLAQHFEGVAVDEITPQAIDSAARALYPNVSPQTRHRQAVTPARAVIGHYTRGGLRKPQRDDARTRWLTPAEAELLIAAAYEVDRRRKKTPAGHSCARVIMFLLGTGARTKEAVRVQVSNINAPTRQVWIAPSKNGDARWAPIETARAFPVIIDNMTLGGGLFRTPKGEDYKVRDNNSGGQFAIMFNKARTIAGFDDDVTPHTLRHTWATWYYAATGHNLAALMSAGGWRSVSMAMRYTKLAPADLAEQIKSHGWQFGQWGKSGEGDARGNIYAVNSGA